MIHVQGKAFPGRGALQTPPRSGEPPCTATEQCSRPLGLVFICMYALRTCVTQQCLRFANFYPTISDGSTTFSLKFHQLLGSPPRSRAGPQAPRHCHSRWRWSPLEERRMGRRRLPNLFEPGNIDYTPYRPRHAAPPKLVRPLLRTWLARVFLPPAPMRTRVASAWPSGATRTWVTSAWPPGATHLTSAWSPGGPFDVGLVARRGPFDVGLIARRGHGNC